MRCLIFILLVAMQSHAEDLMPDERRVYRHNPDYGQALFFLHSGDYQKALGLYGKIKNKGIKGYGKVIDIHQAVAQLGLGMTNESKKQYQRLLGDKRINFIPSTARTQAWFYMARHLYEKGLWGDALLSIRKVNSNYIDKILVDEFNFLATTLELFAGSPKRADKHLLAINIKSKWAVYGYLNLAVSYTERDVHFSKVESVIEKALSLSKTMSESELLADKVNLMAGQFFYATGRGRSAIKHLKSVGLNGPYTAKALLTYGWALTEQWQYHEALQPWYMLKTKYSPLNQDVQETLIAIPHLLEKLNAKVMALGAFDFASEQFDDIYLKLEESAKRLNSGDFIEPLMKQQPLNGWGTFEKLNLFIVENPDQDYLKDIFVSSHVQSELLKLRDIYSIFNNLNNKKDQQAALLSVVNRRISDFKQIKKQKNISILVDRYSKITKKYKNLNEKIEKSLINETGIDLATYSEKQNLKSIENVNKIIISNKFNKNYRSRLRRVDGVLKWDLSQRYFERSEKIKLANSLLKSEINALNKQLISSQYSVKIAPLSFEGFSFRIADLNKKIDEKLHKINKLYAQQKKIVSDIVKQDIKTRQDRVRGFQLQARLAAARLFDETSNKQRLTLGAVNE